MSIKREDVLTYLEEANMIEVSELVKDARLSPEDLQAKLDAKKAKRTQKKEVLAAQKVAELAAQAEVEAKEEAEAAPEAEVAEEAAPEAEATEEAAPEAEVAEKVEEESEEESSDDEKQ